MRQLMRLPIIMIALTTLFCADRAAAESTVLNWSNYAPVSGSYLEAGTPEAMCAVVASNSEWAALWKKLTLINRLSTPAQSVDFESNTLLMLSLGAQTTTGHAILVSEVIDTPDSVFVRAMHVEYASVAMGCQPAAFILVPRLHKPVSFRIMHALGDTGSRRCK
jgi:hypothetical protein